MRRWNHQIWHFTAKLHRAWMQQVSCALWQPRQITAALVNILRSEASQKSVFSLLRGEYAAVLFLRGALSSPREQHDETGIFSMFVWTRKMCLWDGVGVLLALDCSKIKYYMTVGLPLGKSSLILLFTALCEHPTLTSFKINH